MRWLPLLLLFGCTDYKGEELADVVVDEAWIEDLDYSGMMMIGGGFGGAGTLVVMDPQGERHELPVSLSGGGAGLAMAMSLSFPRDVDLKLPRGRLYGNQLLGRYKGSAEALAVLFGAQVNHLRNDDDVQLDFTSATFGVSVLVAAQWATLLPREEEEMTGHTGWYPPVYDTLSLPDDTGEAPTGDTGGSTTTSGDSGTTRHTGR